MQLTAFELAVKTALEFETDYSSSNDLDAHEAVFLYCLVNLEGGITNGVFCEF